MRGKVGPKALIPHPGLQVHGTLESIPAILDNAYQEMNITPESGLALTSAVCETVTYDAVAYDEDATAMVVEGNGAVQHEDVSEQYEEDGTR